MERIIKFRVWDGRTRRMSDPFDFREREAFCFWDGSQYTIATLAAPHNTERFTLMQFTGLHDREGKEIYEGDIVRISGRETFLGVMVFNAQIGRFVFDDGGFWGLTSGDAANVVIGNIYENPNLIEG